LALLNESKNGKIQLSFFDEYKNGFFVDVQNTKSLDSSHFIQMIKWIRYSSDQVA